LCSLHTQPAQELLRLAGASFGYGARTVVAGVDLVVRAGDCIGIVGPNGSGKTTLFRGILGLIPPLAGRVQRGTGSLGYVPQREALDAIYPLTVQEVVQMGAYGHLKGMRRVTRVARRRARALLARVALDDRRSALFASLSGGQRQRVLIARALMVEPRLLLLDEPTSGVDRRAEGLIRDLLQELNREGLAILLVSHQLAMVRQTTQRVLWVGEGGVRECAPEELARAESLDHLYAGGSPETP
jgi:ABC-type Mn2+/Zn2+ transport system ATPase subunit